MNLHRRTLAIVAMTAAFSVPAQTTADIQWWHSMAAVNGEWVNNLVKEFNTTFNTATGKRTDR